MTSFSDSTAADWDAAQSESHVHHEQPTGTDWAAADTVELGPPTYDEGGTNLEAYWPFDEDSGTTANDVSGNGHDGEIFEAVVGTAGIRGMTCYTFDGVNDTIKTPYNGVGGSTNRTFACWVRTSANADQSLVNYGDQSTAGAKWVYRIDEASTTGDWVPRIEVSGGFLRGTTHITDGNWHHIACVLEGTDVQDHTLYVDGTADTVDDSASEAVNTDLTGETVWLGRRPTSWGGSGDRTLNGEMDEVRFYSRALSQAEIQSLAHGDVPTGSLTTATKTVADAAPPEELTTTANLGGGSIDVVVNEDTNQDGTADHSQTVSLAGGTDEVNTLSGFSGGTDVDYWVEIQPSIPSPTATAPTFTSYTVASGAGQSISMPVGSLSATTPAPTATAGAQSVTSPVAGLTTTTPAPSPTAGVANVAPTTTSLTTASTSPTLIAGASSLSPSAAGLSTATPSPSVTGGTTAIGAPTATLTTTTPSQSVTPGSASISPTAVGLTAAYPTESLTVESATSLVSGTFTLDGSGTSGATIIGINDTQDTIAGMETTDANGDYAIEYPVGDEGHFLFQYDDGEQQYSDESKPFIVVE